MECSCFFCDGGKFELNKSLGIEAESSIIYQDDYIYITPDIAPVIEGHFLIITNEHINGFGNADVETFVAMEKAKHFLTEKVFCTEDVLFWEHGEVISHSAGGCIEHAHVHAVPLSHQIDIDKYLDSLDLITPIRHDTNYIELHNIASNGQPYIMYGYGADRSFYRCVEYLPTQFFRIMMSNYHKQQFNWKIRFRENDSKEMFKKTLQYAKGKMLQE